MGGGKSLIERARDAIIVVRDKLTGKSARRQGRDEAYSKYVQKYGREIRALEARIEQRSKDFLDGTKYAFKAQGEQKKRTVKGEFKARFRIKRNGDDGDTKNDKL